jgi:photosystem II stability/assembly factor-like uncharacterized protein
MKTIFTTVLLIMTSYAQWQWQNPLPQGNTIRDIYFTSYETGWAVGNYGLILNTTDGGINWNIKETNNTYNLTSVFFVNNNTGIAAGSSGTILRTTDGGSNWIPQNSGTSFTLNDVFFTDEQNGTVVGTDIMLRTTDGGNSWISYINNSLHYTAVSFADHNNGIAVGVNPDVGENGFIQITTNGGADWSYSLSQSELFTDVFYVTSKKAFIAAGYKELLRTTDGGINWQIFEIEGARYFNSITFPDSNTGYAVDWPSSKLFKTTNGGAEWKYMTEFNFPIFSVFFIDTVTGYAVGDGGVIHRTTDGGYTWQRHITTNPSIINSAAFTTDLNGIAVGNSGNVIITTDGGENWSSKEIGVSGNLYDICFVNHEIGFIAGSEGLLLKTTDGGISWFNPVTGTSLSRILYGITFSDTNNGIAVGELGYIFKTSDGGKNWAVQSNTHKSTLRQVYFIDYHTVIAVGRNGIILKSTDTGVTWSRKNSSTTSVFYDLHFTSLSSGIAVGDNTVKTSDGGETWTLVPGVGGYSVAFTDDNKGFIAGNYGRIFYTEDSGFTWTPQYSGTTNDLRDIVFVNSQNGYIFGRYNTVLKTSNAGVPVVLESLSADLREGKGVLTWTTATENNNRGFEIERKSLNTNWSTRGFVPGAGTTTEPQNYTFSEELEISGKYFYRLKQIDFDGSFEYTEIVQVNFIAVPTEFSLQQNYPNPFNPATTISYSIPEQARVRITLYDALGREVKTLVNEEKAPGNYSISLDAAALATGIYYYHIRAGEFTETRKMLLLR